MHFDWSQFASIFLLGFSSLFPLINPIGTSFILQPYFGELDKTARKKLALHVVTICLSMGIITLHFGSYVLELMGVSIPATQTAGGIVIGVMGFNLFNSDASSHEVNQVEKTGTNSTFYPMAFPLTLGPGGISTLIALGAHVHEKDHLFGAKMAAITLALIVVLVIAYICFTNTAVLMKKLGSNGSQIMNKMMSFLVFCIGIQMTFTGIMGLIHATT